MTFCATCIQTCFPCVYIYCIQSISFKINFASLCGPMARAGCFVHPANPATLMHPHNLVPGSMAAVQSISSSWVASDQQLNLENPDGGTANQAGKSQRLNKRNNYETDGLPMAGTFGTCRIPSNLSIF